MSLKHSLSAIAVAAGLLATAGPASAAITYNGHAGLGAAVSDGTSNTIMFAAAPRGFSIDIGTSENIAADGRELNRILMTDNGGQYYARPQ